MKVAQIIANEMLESHREEITFLSKEALRHEIKLIVDREWASSDPDSLISDVEEAIQGKKESQIEEIETAFINKFSKIAAEEVDIAILGDLVCGTKVSNSIQEPNQVSLNEVMSALADYRKHLTQAFQLPKKYFIADPPYSYPLPSFMNERCSSSYPRNRFKRMHPAYKLKLDEDK